MNWLKRSHSGSHESEMLSHINYNLFFDSDSIGEIMIEVLEIGSLNVPTGKIVVCDPLTHPEIPPFQGSIPPGRYPVKICGVKKENSRQFFAAAKLEIAAQKAVKWVLALKGSEKLSDLKTDEIFGFPVDAGVAGFADQHSQQAYLQFTDRFYDEHPDGNIYDDIFEAEFRKNATHPDQPNDVGDWLDFDIPGQESLNVIMFQSGFGDGFYPAYWGIGENSEPVALVIDFRVLRLPDSQ